VHGAVNVMYETAKSGKQLADCILLNFANSYSLRAATPTYANTKTLNSLFNELV